MNIFNIFKKNIKVREQKDRIERLRREIDELGLEDKITKLEGIKTSLINKKGE